MFCGEETVLVGSDRRANMDMHGYSQALSGYNLLNDSVGCSLKNISVSTTFHLHEVRASCNPIDMWETLLMLRSFSLFR
jgi:hypothetical protein